MKKIFLLTLFFLQILRGVTTAQNPYKSIGKTTEVLTLSNGKYQEFFPNDTIVRIGSVLFNRVTNEVVEFLTDKDSSSLVEADVASRFLSVDPIGRKFPELTPYQFASNTPIQAIDLDGLEAANWWYAAKASMYGVEALKMNNLSNIADIQFQQYRLVIKNPTASVGQLYNKVVSNISSIYDTDYGKFKFEKQNERNSLSEGDYISIVPSKTGLAQIFVKVVGANISKDDNGDITSFDYKFRTLEGHVEVGVIEFSAKTMKDKDGNSFMHFMIESTSQIDPAIGQALSNFDGVRNEQMDNWSQTLGNVVNQVGGEKQSASVYIEKYENGLINKDFNRVNNNPNSLGTPIKQPKSIEQKDLPAKSGSN